MQELTNIEQLNEGVVFLEIYSENCNSCKKQAKLVEMIESNYPNITFLKCNSGEDLGAKLVEDNNLMQAPSMLIFKDNNLIQKFSGLTIPNKLKSILDEVV